VTERAHLRHLAGQQSQWTMFAKRGARQILTPRGVVAAKRAHASVVTRAARKAFESASDGAEQWLDTTELEHLQGTYPPPPEYGYDPVDLERRSLARSRVLSRLLGPRLQSPAVLEVACADAMTCAALRRRGAIATAVDCSPRLFDERARRLGVRFIEADAAELPLQGEQFDLVFSYNSFEHFGRPDAAFREAIRVTKTGGLIYLLFGPLYDSAFGLHAAHAITVPYCQFLFTRDVLDAFVAENRLPQIPYDTLNRWSLTRFRDLWDGSSRHIDRVVYREIPDVHGVELVARHAACFRGKLDDFENLLVGTIEAVLRKTSSEALVG
jgi:SAM-dependent methyltransferase